MKTQFQVEEVRIVDFPGAKVATLEHRGDPRRIGDSIRKFIEWRKQSGLHPRTSATYNVMYDDPATVAPSEYRFDLCAATNEDVAPNTYGIVNKSIPAGRCAVLRAVGGDAVMAQAIRFLYSQWLPHSGADTRDFPLFVQRVRFFPDVPEHEQILDVFLPLAP